VNYPPFEWVKARTVTEDLGKTIHIMVDKEKLLMWNPDIIFVDVLGLAILMQDRSLHPEYYGALKAFQASRVYVLYPFNSYGANIENAIANAYAVGKILYPDRFRDVDIERKADQIYSFLVGKPVYQAMTKGYGALGRSHGLSK
jgi:iron complex transport system substrate-binding protein